MMPPPLTVVVPAWNAVRWLPGCLAALRQQVFREFRLIVVDNGSADGSAALVAQAWPEAALMHFERNRGFAAAVNAGVQASRTDWVALLNADTRPRPDWLAALARAAAAAPPDVGALASKMISLERPDRLDDCGDTLSWQGAAAKRGHGLAVSEYARPDEVFSACAGAALYRRAMLEALGGFDERLFAYLEDVDLGLRARLRGWRCLFVPEAEVLHQGHGSGVRGGRYVRLMTRNRALLFLKNLPASVLRRRAGALLYGQWYFFVAYRRPFSSLAGYLGLLAALPHAWRERRRILPSIALAPDHIEALLEADMPEPPLRALAAAAWRRRIRPAGPETPAREGASP